MNYVYVQLKDKKFIELDKTLDFHAKDAIHPGAILDMWPEDELKTLDIYKVKHRDVPIGKSIKSVSYRLDGNKVVEVLELQDTAPKLSTPEILQKSISGNAEKNSFKEKIDEAAVQLRGEFMTRGMYPVYEAKRQEAEKFITKRPTKTKRAPSLKDFPYLKASLESRVDGDDAATIANKWRAMARQTDEFLAVIETKRLKAKALIDAATTTEEMEKIVHDFNVQ